MPATAPELARCRFCGARILLLAAGCPTGCPEVPPMVLPLKRRERQRADAVAKQQSWAQERAMRKAERRRGGPAPLSRAWQVYLGADPGHPLGKGMPPGPSLRQDGETHREAWMRVLRADLCAYCGAPAQSVDHVHPQSRRTSTTHTWLNYVGACHRCNGSKADRSLLAHLLRQTRRPAAQRRAEQRV